MGCRRRAAHRRPFLKVTGAETTADMGAFTARLKRALGEAEVLGLKDVRGHLDQALHLAQRHAAKDKAIAGEGPKMHSIGEHEHRS